jgi:hypothetical protein
MVAALRRSLRLVLALVVAGCAGAQSLRPVMVAQGGPGGYGYAETRLAVDRYQVRYVTPELDFSSDADRRQTELLAQKQRAFDLALWRAAQLALADGFAYLTVERDRRDADVTTREERSPSVFAMPGVYGPCCSLAPYWFYSDPYGDVRLFVSGRVSADLAVAYARTPATGAVDSAATARRLAAQYGGQTY